MRAQNSVRSMMQYFAALCRGQYSRAAPARDLVGAGSRAGQCYARERFREVFVCYGLAEFESVLKL
jgi:hypothetical protein